MSKRKDEQEEAPPRLTWEPEKCIPGTDLVLRYPLGQGGMGSVYAVEHRSLGRWFAVKVLNREFTNRPDMIERLKLEARALGELYPHENLVQVVDFRQAANGRWFLQMELLQGKTLDDTLGRNDSRLDPAYASHITLGVLNALDCAHRHRLRLIHRDVKPSNIFLVQQNNATVVKLLDFGVAKILTDGATKINTAPGVAIGTAQYMCPEVLDGLRADERADIYSTGMVLFEMLTGQTPFPNVPAWQDLARLVLMGIGDDVYAKVPNPFRTIVRQATARNREDRYPSARLFVDDLRLAVKRLPAHAQKSPPPVWTSIPIHPPSNPAPDANANANAHAVEQELPVDRDTDVIPLHLLPSPQEDDFARKTAVVSYAATTKPAEVPATDKPAPAVNGADVSPGLAPQTPAEGIANEDIPPGWIRAPLWAQRLMKDAAERARVLASMPSAEVRFRNAPTPPPTDIPPPPSSFSPKVAALALEQVPVPAHAQQGRRSWFRPTRTLVTIAFIVVQLTVAVLTWYWRDIFPAKRSVPVTNVPSATSR